MSDATGKVVAITGASSGIGEAAGRVLAAAGAKVILGARRADRLETIANDIRKSKGEVDIQAIDVTKREDLALFVKKAQDRFGRLDVLIGNAGLMPLCRGVRRTHHPSLWNPEGRCRQQSLSFPAPISISFCEAREFRPWCWLGSSQIAALNQPCAAPTSADSTS